MKFWRKPTRYEDIIEYGTKISQFKRICLFLFLVTRKEEDNKRYMRAVIEKCFSLDETLAKMEFRISAAREHVAVQGVKQEAALRELSELKKRLHRLGGAT